MEEGWPRLAKTEATPTVERMLELMGGGMEAHDEGVKLTP